MQRDKVQHFIAGAVIAGALSLVFDPLVGFAAGVFAGAAKEVRDKYTAGATVDFLDFMATAGGAALAALLVYTL